MPTNVRIQNLRVTTGFLDTVADDLPGGSVGQLLTGLVAQAQGQLGGKVTLGSGEVKLSSSYRNLDNIVVKGTFQYIQTLSTDTVVPAQGLIAFWHNKDNYIVTTSDTVPQQRAGVFLGQLPRGKYGFIQTFDDGKGLVRGADASVFAADELVFPISNGSAVADRVTVAGATAPQAITSFGIAEGAKNATTGYLPVAFGSQISQN